MALLQKPRTHSHTSVTSTPHTPSSLHWLVFRASPLKPKKKHWDGKKTKMVHFSLCAADAAPLRRKKEKKNFAQKNIPHPRTPPLPLSTTIRRWMCSHSKRTVGTLCLVKKKHHIKKKSVTFFYIFLFHTPRSIPPPPPSRTPFAAARPPTKHKLKHAAPPHHSTALNTPPPHSTPFPTKSGIANCSREGNNSAFSLTHSPTLTLPFHTLTTPNTCVAQQCSTHTHTHTPPPSPAFRLQTEGVATGFYLTTATTQRKKRNTKRIPNKHYPSRDRNRRQRERWASGGMQEQCALSEKEREREKKKIVEKEKLRRKKKKKKKKEKEKKYQ
eukprot:Rhum_TRINITY_DN14890_c0_g2::Rhum_TRINITY_DN14890_c0_g2_i1::g.126555::m.126555